MKRIAKLILCGWILAEAPIFFAQADLSPTMTFNGAVNSIVAWIDKKSGPTAPTGLDDWDNESMSASETDATAIYRLVTNQNILLTATTQETLTQDLGGSVTISLATFYNVVSDGNGSSASGFQAAENGNGVGTDNFQYVGGGSDDWETYAGYTAGTFLGAGKTLTHITLDGAILLTVSVRGWNPEDLDSDSNNTEAPDPGTYTADLTLVATAI